MTRTTTITIKIELPIASHRLREEDTISSHFAGAIAEIGGFVRETPGAKIPMMEVRDHNGMIDVDAGICLHLQVGWRLRLSRGHRARARPLLKAAGWGAKEIPPEWREQAESVTFTGAPGESLVDFWRRAGRPSKIHHPHMQISICEISGARGDALCGSIESIAGRGALATYMGGAAEGWTTTQP